MRNNKIHAIALPQASANRADSQLYGMLGFPPHTRHTTPPRQATT